MFIQYSVIYGVQMENVALLDVCLSDRFIIPCFLDAVEVL